MKVSEFFICTSSIIGYAKTIELGSVDFFLTQIIICYFGVVSTHIYPLMFVTFWLSPRIFLSPKKARNRKWMKNILILNLNGRHIRLFWDFSPRIISHSPQEGPGQIWYSFHQGCLGFWIRISPKKAKGNSISFSCFAFLRLFLEKIFNLVVFFFFCFLGT